MKFPSLHRPASRRVSFSSCGFSLVELLIAIGIVAVLAVMVTPAFRGVMSGANLTKCTNNLRQWGLGYQGYMNEHDGLLPQQAEVSGNADTHWQELIAPYVIGNDRIWNQRNALRAKLNCPADKMKGVVYACSHYLSPLRYANYAPAKLASLTYKLSDFLLMSENYTGEFWDLRPATTSAMAGRIDYTRHNIGGKEYANFMFADLHIERLTLQQAETRPVIYDPRPARNL